MKSNSISNYHQLSNTGYVEKTINSWKSKRIEKSTPRNQAARHHTFRPSRGGTGASDELRRSVTRLDTRPTARRAKAAAKTELQPRDLWGKGEKM